jgi:superfamily I DNA/RNA helicase
LKIQKTYLGPPGCGKTQNNSNLVKEYINQGIDPERIACVSFTRKAARESRERVCHDCGLEEDRLPHFQTLHSIAFREGGYKVSEVMRGEDFRKIGEAIGLSFGRDSKSLLESDFDTLGVSKGDFYMNIYHLARSKNMTWEEMFRQAGNYNLHFSELRRLVETYEEYKSTYNKIDFTDMIEEFIQRGNSLDVDALFVDEAQDLSTLQWQMVDILREAPDIQIFAGDDDQAIMGFQGADVPAFLSATQEREVLNQSYRIPNSVWHVAQSIVSRIEGRAPKEWKARPEEGLVQQHQDLWDVPLEEGEWCIMARTNRIASTYADSLRDEGWVYSRNGHPSIPPKMYEGILSWEALSKGKSLDAAELRNMYSFMTAGDGYAKGFGPRSKGLLHLDTEILINMDFARSNLGLLYDGETRWHRSLDKISRDMQHYLLNALKRGDNVKHPRIKVSTIHSMKGGEADNILVVPDLSYAADREYQTNPSTEHRVFYVAVTRAKKALHLMEPSTDKYYSI